VGVFLYEKAKREGQRSLPHACGGVSMGDALMMSMFSPKAKVAEAAKINFQGWGS